MSTPYLNVQWFTQISLSPSTTRLRSQWRRYVLTTALIIIVLNLYSPAEPSLSERFYASSLIALAVVPLLRWITGRDLNSPLIVFVSLLYAVYCALPVFVLERYSRAWYVPDVVPSEDLEYALLLSNLGVIMMLFGYYSGVGRVIASRLARPILKWGPTRAINDVAIGLTVTGILLRIELFRYTAFGGEPVFSSQSAVQECLYYLLESGPVGLTILWTLDLSGNLGRLSTCLLRFCVIPIFLFLGVATGTLGQAMRVGLTLLFVYSTLYRRVPWLVLSIGFVSLLVLQPAKTMFRADLAGQAAESGIAGSVSRLEAFATSIYTVATQGQSSEPGFLTLAADRMNMITTFANVILLTPSQIPYWDGYTFLPLLSKLIPRFMYPNKRVDDVSQAFPHRYGFLAQNDFMTSYKLPPLIEGYINFGLPGVLVVMFALGCVYRLLQEALIHPRMGLAHIVALTYISVQWLDIEGNVSLVFGGLPFEVLYLILIGLLIDSIGRFLRE
jgi:hypothetical protein